MEMKSEMKATVYLKIAKKAKGYEIVSTTMKPRSPVKDYPTVILPVEINIPDALFEPLQPVKIDVPMYKTETIATLPPESKGIVTLAVRLSEALSKGDAEGAAQAAIGINMSVDKFIKDTEHLSEKQEGAGR